MSEKIAEDVLKFEIQAPRIAEKRKPGQFVVIRVDEKGERIPLTIVDSNLNKGTITLIFQVVGVSTRKLASLKTGDSLMDVLGPLGHATHLEKYGKVIAIGGGVGIAPLYPISKGMKDAGNSVIAILGARSKNLMILEREMKAICTEIHLVTDDGSYGEKGLVTNVLKKMLDTGTHPDIVIAIGPLVMMKAVSELTQPYGIKTMVSLNPIMVDGTGMCGGCRVDVAGEIKFACVDGPEFDGHAVNFDKLSIRLKAYKTYEKHSMEQCKLQGMIK
ncbi:MAG: sulfide/dihydroorotate dehydrogenase-like FAD/NAD-binding protein [Candidatus Aureabacteria bacterium]|nr:sulfide/dihydroorotate dehydrogenase-like FAD/NAD-binding protein [Candidatus Auribacterota bacterium]